MSTTTRLLMQVAAKIQFSEWYFAVLYDLFI